MNSQTRGASMYTLLLRIAAPLQAWGDESKFEIRRTQREPTKSGILGMVAAAMGKKRDESLEELVKLSFGVRVDQEGAIKRDFHMVHKDAKTSYLTYRDYLEDAVFLVGLSTRIIQYWNRLLTICLILLILCIWEDDLVRLTFLLFLASEKKAF